MAETSPPEPAGKTVEPERGRELNVFFRLTVAVASVFVVTILASLSTLFGDPLSPVNQFLEQRANSLLIAEVVLILLLALLALIVDRRQTLGQETTTAPPGSSATTTAATAATTPISSRE
ncbi:MAG: hypothetical protein ABGZ35_14100 [Planctomycetaceae bacterium]